jgi:tetratricopeptide (TPR) repeat protein
MKPGGRATFSRMRAMLPLLLLLSVVPAHATPTDGAGTGNPAATMPGPDALQAPGALDDLYKRLAASKTSEEAEAIAAAIDRVRMRSGSDTIDLLMGRALQASQSGDNALAIELLSAVIGLKPDFTEAWNKRATLLFMENNFARSMSDIAETLKRDPRHYGAWAGLGMILYQSDDKKRAYDAFKRALAINPHLEDIKKTVEDLTLDVEGQGI